MFGLWGNEEEEQPDNVQEFDYAAQEMIAQAPDLDTGLAGLRDVYADYGFEDSKKAQELLEQRSTELRQRFNTHTQYNFDETIQNAPYSLSDVELDKDYKDDSSKNIALINKWEEENIRELEESTDTINIQNRSKYKRDIQKAASTMRREVFGADNYVVDGDTLKYEPSWGSVIGDTALSVGQGIVGGAAKLVGWDEVNDWFEEGIDPGFQENYPYWSAISSGAGTAVGAVASAAATMATTGTPIGAAGYLGVSGAGEAVEQYREAKETGATTGEALTAGGIEAASQAGQALVGGKIFGKVAGKVLGKTTSTLGAKVFPKIAESKLGTIALEASAEAITEGAGQVASNVAKDIGQGTDTPLLKGVGTAMVAGGVVAGVSSGVGEYAGAKRSLAETIEETEGAPPPPREGAREPTQPVDLSNPATVVTNEDGSSLVTEEGRLHIKKGETALEAHSDNFFISKETWDKLQALKEDPSKPNELGHTPDGAGLQLTTRNGSLYLESVQPFLSPDLTIDNNAAGSIQVEVPTTEGAPGDFHIGVSPVVTKKGMRSYKFDIAPSPVKEISTAGAAHISTLGKTVKESQYVKKVRERYKDNPEMLEMSGMAETNVGTGELIDIPWPQYMQTEKGANRLGFEKADERIDNESPVKLLSYLDSLKKADDQDAYLSERLVLRLESGINKAKANKDYANQKLYAALLNDARAMRDKIGTLAGRTLQVMGAKSAEADITEIETHLTVQAESELSGELRRPVTLEQLNEEAENASKNVAAIEKELAIDPVTKEMTDLDTQSDKADEEVRTGIDEKIKGHVDTLQEIKQRKKAVRTTDTAQAIESVTESYNKKIQKHTDDIQEIKNRKKAVRKQASDNIESVKQSIKEEKQKASDTIAEVEKDLQITKAQIEKAKTKKEKNDLLRRAASEERRIESLTKKLDTLGKTDISKIKAREKEKVAKAVKDLNDLARQRTKRIRDLREDHEKTKTKIITNQRENTAKAIKDLNDLARQRTKRIRELKEEKKTATSKTREKNEKRKAELNEVKKDAINRVRLNPEQQERYSRAKSEEQKLRDALARGEKKLKEKLDTFPPEQQERVRQLYKALENATPTDAVRINDEILQIRAKFSPPTKATVDSLWTYWRKNALSGVETALRNSTTVSNLVSSTASYALGDVYRGVRGKSPGVLTSTEYMKGIIDGFKKKGIPEALEILQGRRGGRLQLSDNGRARQQAVPLRTRATLAQNPLNPLLDIAEVMNRVLGATDAFIYHSAEGGQYRVAAAMLELKGENVTPAKIDQVLFGDRQKVIAEVKQRAAVLRSLNIDISKSEEDLMVREALEMRRSKTLREVSEKGGLENTFMNEPHPTVLGVMAKGISYAINNINIPYTSVHPGKFVLPFVPTAANIGDMWLAHTPLGIVRYAKMREKQSALIERNKAGAIEAAKKGKTFTPEIDTYELAAQEQLGRVILGTAAMGIVAAILAGQDKDKPLFKFYGRPSPEERPIWQAQGIPPFSLRIKDAIVTKEMLGPLALAFAFGDNIAKYFKSEVPLQWALPNTIFLSMGAISEMSFLPSVSNFFQALEGGGKVDDEPSSSTKARWLNFAGSSIAGFAQPLIPASGFLRNVYKWYDGDPQETFNNLAAKFANNIPWAREMVGAPTKINRFGEPIHLDITKRLPTGVFMSRVMEDPVSSWMQATGYDISPQGPTIKLNKGELGRFQSYRKEAGATYADTLDEVEARKVLEISGPKIKLYLEMLMNDPRYSTFTPERQEEIHKYVAKVRAQARDQVLIKNY